VILGQEIDVQLVVSEPATGEQLNTVTSTHTLLVKGLDVKFHDESMLELYFSNHTRCRGGDIAETIVKDKEAYITFVEPGGIIIAVFNN